ncbi:MAG: hypothetical protein KCHDKBKB_00079 [Elusimicrobia bacterium]|nr:hypothetical protein [Elusimicrobiota bacterium]
MKNPSLVNKVFAASLCVSLLTTQCVFAHRPEINFWSERRKSLPPSQTEVAPPLQWASLPAMSSPLMRISLPSALPPLSLEESPQLHPLFQSLSPRYGTVRKVSLPQRVYKKPSSRHASGRDPGFASDGNLGPGQKIAGATVPRGFYSGSQNLMSEKIILHIQDVHMNPEAQTNIGKTIQELIDHQQVDLIALEGAFGPINLTDFRSFPHQDTLHKVADFLLKENKISGPLHAALRLRPDQVLPPLVGVDDPQHHQANVEAYQQSVPLMKTAKEQLGLLEGKLESQKAKVLNPELASFDRHVTAHRRGQITFGDYVQFLSGSGAPVSPTLQTFLHALNLEASLNFSQVEAERSHLLSKLVPKLTPQETTSLTRHSIAYRSGEINHATFYRYVQDLCEQNGVSLTQFPALRTYLRYVLLSDAVNAEDLLKEVSLMEESRFSSLAQTEEEKALIALSKRRYLIGKLVDFSLTPEEWEEYKRRNHKSQTLNSKQTENSKSETPNPVRGFDVSDFKFSSSLEFETCDLKFFESFYKEAQARDQAMTQNLLREMASRNAKVAVLVTGGFHAKGIEQLTRQAGLTTLSFVPKITQIPTDNGNAYLSVFTQEKSPLDKLFEGEKLFLAKTPWTTTIARQAAVWVVGLSFFSGVVAATPLKNWFHQVTGFQINVLERLMDKTVHLMASGPGGDGALQTFDLQLRITPAWTIDVLNSAPVATGWGPWSSGLVWVSIVFGIGAILLRHLPLPQLFRFMQRRDEQLDKFLHWVDQLKKIPPGSNQDQIQPICRDVYGCLEGSFKIFATKNNLQTRNPKHSPANNALIALNLFTFQHNLSRKVVDKKMRELINQLKKRDLIDPYLSLRILRFLSISSFVEEDKDILSFIELSRAIEDPVLDAMLTGLHLIADFGTLDLPDLYQALPSAKNPNQSINPKSTMELLIELIDSKRKAGQPSDPEERALGYLLLGVAPMVEPDSIAAPNPTTLIDKTRLEIDTLHRTFVAFINQENNRKILESCFKKILREFWELGGGLSPNILELPTENNEIETIKQGINKSWAAKASSFFIRTFITLPEVNSDDVSKTPLEIILLSNPKQHQEFLDKIYSSDAQSQEVVRSLRLLQTAFNNKNSGSQETLEATNPQSWIGKRGGKLIYGGVMPFIEEGFRWGAIQVGGITGALAYAFVHALPHYFTDVRSSRGSPERITKLRRHFWQARLWNRLLASLFFSLPYSIYLLTGSSDMSPWILPLVAFTLSFLLHAGNNLFLPTLKRHTREYRDTRIYRFLTQKWGWRWLQMSAAHKRKSNIPSAGPNPTKKAATKSGLKKNSPIPVEEIFEKFAPEFPPSVTGLLNKPLLNQMVEAAKKNREELEKLANQLKTKCDKKALPYQTQPIIKKLFEFIWKNRNQIVLWKKNTEPTIGDSKQILTEKGLGHKVGPPYTNEEGAWVQDFQIGPPSDGKILSQLLKGYSPYLMEKLVQVFSLQKDIYLQFFKDEFWKRINKSLSPTDQVLDLGTGLGHHLEALDLASSARITAFEYMPGFVKELKIRFPQIKVIQGDWENFETLPSHTYSAVTGLNALSYALNEEVLKKIFDGLERLWKPTKEGKIHIVHFSSVFPFFQWFGPDLQQIMESLNLNSNSLSDDDRRAGTSQLIRVARQNFLEIAKKLLKERGYTFKLLEKTRGGVFPASQVHAPYLSKGSNQFLSEGEHLTIDKNDTLPDGQVRQRVTLWGFHAYKNMSVKGKHKSPHSHPAPGALGYLGMMWIVDGFLVLFEPSLSERAKRWVAGLSQWVAAGVGLYVVWVYESRFIMDSLIHGIGDNFFAAAFIGLILHFSLIGLHHLSKPLENRGPPWGKTLAGYILLLAFYALTSSLNVPTWGLYGHIIFDLLVMGLYFLGGPRGPSRNGTEGRGDVRNEAILRLGTSTNNQTSEFPFPEKGESGSGYKEDSETSAAPHSFLRHTFFFLALLMIGEKKLPQWKKLNRTLDWVGLVWAPIETTLLLIGMNYYADTTIGKALFLAVFFFSDYLLAEYNAHRIRGETSQGEALAWPPLWNRNHALSTLLLGSLYLISLVIPLLPPPLTDLTLILLVYVPHLALDAVRTFPATWTSAARFRAALRGTEEIPSSLILVSGLGFLFQLLYLPQELGWIMGSIGSFLLFRKGHVTPRYLTPDGQLKRTAPRPSGISFQRAITEIGILFQGLHLMILYLTAFWSPSTSGLNMIAATLATGLFHGVVYNNLLAPWTGRPLAWMDPFKSGPLDDPRFVSHAFIGDLALGIFNPVSAWRTRNKDPGMGDFDVLPKVIQFAKKMNLKILQLLPLTRSTSNNCPYSFQSSFLIDSVYIGLETLRSQLGMNSTYQHKTYEKTLKLMADAEPIFFELSRNQRSRPDAVRRLKDPILQSAFEEFMECDLPQEKEALLTYISGEGELDMNSGTENARKFKSYLRQKRNFLTDHVHFSILAEEYQSDDIRASAWPRDIACHDPQAVRLSLFNHREKVLQGFFVQWIATEQLSACHVLSQEGEDTVDLALDQPIAFGRADVWANMDAFIIDRETLSTPYRQGAPPHRIDIPQHWQFYVLDTQKTLAKKLLLDRLTFYLQFGNRLRIDHSLGFYRQYYLSENGPTLQQLGVWEEIENIQNNIQDISQARQKIYTAILDAMKRHFKNNDSTKYDSVFEASGNLRSGNVVLAMRKKSDEEKLEREKTGWYEQYSDEYQQTLLYALLSPNEHGNVDYLHKLLSGDKKLFLAPTDTIQLGFYNPSYGEEIIAAFMAEAQRQGKTLVLENLGVVPPEVARANKELGVSQFKPGFYGFQYFTGDNNAYWIENLDGQDEAQFGTGDTIPLAEWWTGKGAWGRTKYYLKSPDQKQVVVNWLKEHGYLSQEANISLDTLTPELHEAVLVAEAQSRAGSVVITMSDWAGRGDEGIYNMPGKAWFSGDGTTPNSETFWTVRDPFTIEDLLEAADRTTDDQSLAYRVVTLMRRVAQSRHRNSFKKQTDHLSPDHSHVLHTIPHMGPGSKQMAYEGEQFIVSATVKSPLQKPIQTVEVVFDDGRRFPMRKLDVSTTLPKDVSVYQIEIDVESSVLGTNPFRIQVDGQVKTDSGFLVGLRTGTNANPVSPHHGRGPVREPYEELTAHSPLKTEKWWQEQRWFLQKGEPIADITLVDTFELTDGAAGCRIFASLYNVQTIRNGGKRDNLYFVPEIILPARSDSELPNSSTHQTAEHSLSYLQAVFRRLRNQAVIHGQNGSIRFDPIPTRKEQLAGLLEGPKDLLAGSEKKTSNSLTSAILRGINIVIKTLRQGTGDVEPEMYKALSTFPGVPGLYGTAHYQRSGTGESIPLLIVMDQINGPENLKSYQTTAGYNFWFGISEFIKEMGSKNSAAEMNPVEIFLSQQYAPHETHRELAKKMAKLIAEFHVALAQNPAPGFGSILLEDPQQLQESIVQGPFRTLTAVTETLSGPIIKEFTDFMAVWGRLAEELTSQVLPKLVPVQLSRTHGDMQLDQIVFDRKYDLFLLDLGGSPKMAPEEKRQRTLALLDLGGLIRAFGYIKFAVLHTVTGLNSREIFDVFHGEMRSTEDSKKWGPLLKIATDVERALEEMVVEEYIHFMEEKRHTSILMPNWNRNLVWAWVDFVVLGRALHEMEYELSVRPEATINEEIARSTDVGVWVPLSGFIDRLKKLQQSLPPAPAAIGYLLLVPIFNGIIGKLAPHNPRLRRLLSGVSHALAAMVGFYGVRTWEYPILLGSLASGVGQEFLLVAFVGITFHGLLLGFNHLLKKPEIRGPPILATLGGYLVLLSLYALAAHMGRPELALAFHLVYDLLVIGLSVAGVSTVQEIFRDARPRIVPPERVAAKLKEYLEAESLRRRNGPILNVLTIGSDWWRSGVNPPSRNVTTPAQSVSKILADSPSSLGLEHFGSKADGGLPVKRSEKKKGRPGAIHSREIWRELREISQRKRQA